ncbi:peptidylprolyl isomerase [Clostridium senegalense]|uniref:peptidylprolyl isomerase n=1 Tax=Clostridium senegalense TaxID=1465809 RepID=A0A6M0H7Y4_9CLOT|nr:peptidylprolyl isomerase [Clostridium senegalense]
MKSVKKIVATCLIAAMTTSLVGCNLIERTPEGVAKSTVAKINGEKIKRSEVDARMKSIQSQITAEKGEDYLKSEEGKTLLTQYRTQMLNQIVGEKILQNKATELKVMPTEEEFKTEIDKEYKTITDSFDSEDKFKAALQQTGETEESLKNNIRNKLIYDKVHDAVVKDVKVTDEEIKAHYDSNMDKYTEQPNKTNLKHILVGTEEEANAVIERLKKGEDFDAVGEDIKAKQAEKDAAKTDDSKKEDAQTSGNRFEDLGWVEFENSGFDATFMQFAKPLTKGNYTTAPVHTQWGYHIIKCYDKQEYPVKAFDKVKEEIKTELQKQKQETTWNETAEKWQKEANIKTYEKNLK